MEEGVTDLLNSRAQLLSIDPVDEITVKFGKVRIKSNRVVGMSTTDNGEDVREAILNKDHGSVIVEKQWNYRFI